MEKNCYRHLDIDPGNCVIWNVPTHLSFHIISCYVFSSRHVCRPSPHAVCIDCRFLWRSRLTPSAPGWCHPKIFPLVCCHVMPFSWDDWWFGVIDGGWKTRNTVCLVNYFVEIPETTGVPGVLVRSKGFDFEYLRINTFQGLLLSFLGLGQFGHCKSWPCPLARFSELEKGSNQFLFFLPSWCLRCFAIPKVMMFGDSANRQDVDDPAPRHRTLSRVFENRSDIYI